MTYDRLSIVTGYLPAICGLNATRPGFTPREATMNDFGLPLWALAYQVLPEKTSSLIFNAAERPGLWIDLEITDDVRRNVI